MSGVAQHSERDHATWSASSTARNWHCAGALTLAEQARATLPEKESIHAARGTAAHQISEKCLAQDLEPDLFLGATEHTKEQAIEIDEELVNSARAYVDYVRSRLTDNSILMIEQKFDLSILKPPFDAGGTGDAVIYLPDEKLLEIVDLKNGTGYVDEKENPQLRTYGLGALLANSSLNVETVRTTIVQPRLLGKRAEPRSEDIHVVDLLEWTGELLEAMNRSKAAMDEYEAAGGNSVKIDEWAERWLRPGKCTFCPAEGSCPALRKGALDIAKVYFEDFGEPKIGNSALDEAPDAIARDLEMIPMLEDWIRARRALAHRLAEHGTQIPGHVLTDKIGKRRIIEGMETDLVTAVIDAGFDRDDLYTEPKLKSPAQLEKVLGKKHKDLIAGFIECPVTGTNLVSEGKTTREPAKTVADKYFENGDSNG